MELGLQLRAAIVTVMSHYFWQPLWMRLLTEVLLHLALDRGTSDEYS